MKKHPQAPRLNQIAALLATSSFAAMLALPAHAQDAKPADAATADAKADAVGLDRVVVTGTSQAKSKMRSSVSVTDVDQEQVTNLGARSEAEVLKLIPGIRAESSAGPGGNSNIAVRGLPIASGGAKFVQFQEDGLPVVEFGDMNFGNNDYFIRFDNNVDRIQTLRGGSAATLASQAPGAVINYISKTGSEPGGSVALTRGLNYNETRVDADYGGRLTSDLTYHIGGYFRDGEGPRKSDTSSLHGYQLKGNITKTFNGGKGYVRGYFKVLDENAPTYTGMPAVASVSGTSVSGMSALKNFDIRTESQLSIYNQTMPTADLFTGRAGVANISNGITVSSKAVGLEFKNEMDGWTVEDRFKISSTSSSFQTQFWSANTLAGVLGNLGGASAKYFNGALAGQTVTTANLKTGLVSQGAAINQQSPDMGHFANDLSVSRNFDLSGSKLNAKAGLYMSKQDIVQQWQISERVMEIGHNGALIDIYDGAGNALTTAGLTGYNNQWGGCCARDIDAHYSNTAPYLALNLESGDFDFEGALRRDNFKGRGSYAGGKQVVGGVDVDGNGTISGAEKNVYLVDNINRSPINYDTSYTSYSLGANYRATKDLSVFARVSKGGRAIADRLLFSPFVDAKTGALTAGLENYAVATVKQKELGVKYRGKFDGGNFGLFATLFQTTTEEYDYDQTRTVGPKLNVKGFKANGLELESALSWGAFGLNANAVYTDQKVTKDLVGTATGNSTVGKTPGGQPKWIYSLSPRYTFGQVTVGGTMWGQTAVWNNDFDTAQVAGRAIFNAFASYQLSDNTSVNLNVSNLFNKIASSGGVGGPSNLNGQQIVELRPEAGRTASVTLRYAF
ncbi:TonB-dependent receptor domain-containing protein [Ideonella alba]|uniref:TonB-dependent receptor n=1 Tax=Ideonella alba TaxID=2824118 RepID=A0A940YBR2_9BURK|nr:TonB-dependent receptor [Ideonella alba]MBQ0933622.1 TonB-dependent receptor [Ideonella alba]